MSSQESVAEILSKLSEWSVQEVQENMSQVLPVLLSCLQSNEQKGLSLQAVQALLTSCLPCVPINSVEENLLQFALPAVENLFNEALEGVNITLQDENNKLKEQEEETVLILTSLLQVCVELLSNLNCTLDYIKEQGQVEATKVPSVPKVIMPVLFESFKHCKESEKLYGDIFRLVGESLSNLFKKAHEIQTHFYAVMQNNLKFKCIYEDDVNLLSEVLRIIVNIGEIIEGLGLKCMATLWKSYISIIEQHLEYLKDVLDVATPIRFLATSVSDALSSIVQAEQDQICADYTTRLLKVGSFELKIILKLCEHFAGYLGECYQELLYLLVSLHRYSLPYLHFVKLQTDIAKATESHLIVGAEPLLMLLISDRAFVQAYFNGVVTFSDTCYQPLGYILLTVSIQKKLLDCDQDVWSMWFGSIMSSNLVCALFNILEHCHEELCWDLHFPGIMHEGEPAKVAELYEHVLTHTSAFVLTTPDKEFPIMERLLLENVLQSCEWRALLAMDIWCIVARHGSTDLCFQHFCYLVDILKKFSPAYYCPEKIFLMTLVGRLFTLLSNKQKSQVVELLPPIQYPIIWNAIGCRMLPDTFSVERDLISLAISDIRKFNLSSTTPEVCNEMLSSLLGATIVGSDSHNQPFDLACGIVSLWHRLSPFITVEEDSRWLNHFIPTLCNITVNVIAHMDTQQLIQVLYKLQVCTASSSSSVKLAVTDVLRSLAMKYIEATSEKFTICNNIGAMFTSLLQDKNPLICQAASEVFAYFAYVTKHEEIVRLSVNSSKGLQQQTTMYFKKLPFQPVSNSEKFLKFGDYLKFQSKVKFTHKYIEEDTDVKQIDTASSTNLDVSLHQPVKRSKLESDNIVEVIQCLWKDAGIITEYCVHNVLPPHAKQELKNLINQLNTLT